MRINFPELLTAIFNLSNISYSERHLKSPRDL